MRVNNKVLAAILFSCSLLLLVVIYLAVDTFVPVAVSSMQTTAQQVETTTVPLIADALVGRRVSACR